MEITYVTRGQFPTNQGANNHTFDQNRLCPLVSDGRVHVMRHWPGGETDRCPRQGTLVDAAIIHAPNSPKNAAGQRDPEAADPRATWLKAPIGADVDAALSNAESRFRFD